MTDPHITASTPLNILTMMKDVSNGMDILGGEFQLKEDIQSGYGWFRSQNDLTRRL